MRRVEDGPDEAAHRGDGTEPFTSSSGLDDARTMLLPGDEERAGQRWASSRELARRAQRVD